MMRFFAIAVLLSAICFAPKYNSAHAQAGWLDVAAPLVQAYQQISSVLEMLSNGHRAASAVATGRRPPAWDGSWQQAVDAFERAESTIRQIDIQTNFDDSRYQVSFDQIVACHTKPGAMVRLTALRDELHAAVLRGDATLSMLTKADEELTKIQEAIVELKKDAELLRTINLIPEYRTIFDLLSYDLEVHIGRAANSLQSTLMRKITEVKASLQTARQRESNLAGWIDDFQRAECSVAGTWSGQINVEGTVSTMIVHLMKSGSNYSMTLSIAGRNNPNVCLQLVSVPNRTMRFRAACSGPAQSLISNLTFSNDYRNLSGAQTDDADSSARFPISLSIR